MVDAILPRDLARIVQSYTGQSAEYWRDCASAGHIWDIMQWDPTTFGYDHYDDGECEPLGYESVWARVHKLGLNRIGNEKSQERSRSRAYFAELIRCEWEDRSSYWEPEYPHGGLAKHISVFQGSSKHLMQWGLTGETSCRAVIVVPRSGIDRYILCEVVGALRCI